MYIKGIHEQFGLRFKRPKFSLEHLMPTGI